MTKVKSIVRPVVKEFQMNNCGFDHHSADDFVKSQWQTRTKSFIFLLYRCFIAAFYLAVVIYSMIDGFSNGLYFIYLTNWGIMLCMVTTMLGAILVCTWYLHPEFADRVKDSNEMPIPFKIYWGMHVITLILSMGITIIYWSVLYNDLVQVTAVNILTHAFNSVLMFVDLWIVAYPVRLLHMFLPVCFGLVYAIFSVIYYAAGGVDPAGKHYIYPILDWDYPGKAILTVIGVILLCCALYIFIFYVYKLRVFIHRRYNRKQVFEPSQCTGRPSSTPVTLPSNRISMVLGDYGHDHLAFTNSSEKIVS